MEIETNSLNITFAKAVPNSDKIKIYPIELLTSEEDIILVHGKSTKRRTTNAGITIAIKFPKAIAKAGTP